MLSAACLRGVGQSMDICVHGQRNLDRPLDIAVTAWCRHRCFCSRIRVGLERLTTSKINSNMRPAPDDDGTRFKGRLQGIKIAFLCMHFGDRETERQTNRQTDGQYQNVTVEVPGLLR